MAERISRGQGQITLVDLTDSKHLISYISADNQRQVIYDPELDEYQPNFENEPLTLQAELYTVGEPNNIITNAKDITWYRKPNSTGEKIQVYNSSVYSVDNDKVTIQQNILEDKYTHLFIAEITWTDPDSNQDILINADIELVKVSNGNKGDQGATGPEGQKGEDGENAIVPIIITPEGDTIRNHNGNLEAQLILYEGGQEVTPQTIRWYQSSPSSSGDSYSGTGWSRLSGESSDSLTVDPVMIDGTNTFLVVVTYQGDDYRATVTMHDIVDPVQVEIIGSTIFKNSRGSNTLTCKVYQTGQEIDVNNESGFTYNWYVYNQNGEQDTSFSKNGKTITVTSDEVDHTVSLFCEVSE